MKLEIGNVEFAYQSTRKLCFEVKFFERLKWFRNGLLRAGIAHGKDRDEQQEETKCL